MADNPTLDVQVVSPEEVMYQGAAEMVVCRTTDGDVAFLPGHMPFLGALGIARVRALLPGEGEQVVAVHGGFVEVSNNRVLILSDVAELPGEIDVPRAEAAPPRAQDRLAADEHDQEAAAALARADLRLEIAGVTESSAAG